MYHIYPDITQGILPLFSFKNRRQSCIFEWRNVCEKTANHF